MRETMPRYFRIEAETQRLRSAPSAFENIRNNYDYRTEVLLNDPIHNENVAGDVLLPGIASGMPVILKIIPTFAEILAA